MLKQQQEVVGFDGTRYLSRLLWATSSGGVEVPVSVAYRGGEWPAWVGWGGVGGLE